MKTPTDLFLEWLDLFFIGKESLTPKQLETLKAKLKTLKDSKASDVKIVDITKSQYERPKPEAHLEFQPFTFKKDE